MHGRIQDRRPSALFDSRCSRRANRRGPREVMSANAQTAPGRRIEVVIRNIAREVPAIAMGTLTIDFGDQVAFDAALETLATGLKNPLEQAVILKNERCESLGFNPHHYSYHRAFATM